MPPWARDHARRGSGEHFGRRDDTRCCPHITSPSWQIMTETRRHTHCVDTGKLPVLFYIGRVPVLVCTLALLSRTMNYNFFESPEKCLSAVSPSANVPHSL